MIDMALREQVARANADLVRAGLVTLSFGNVSGVDRDSNALVIKPSGVACDQVRPEDLVVVSLEDGRVLQGTMRPSSDTPTHLRLYQAYPDLGGVVHTHSSFAAAFAQAGRDIPALGTTHADHFRGPVPTSRLMTEAEIEGQYELETGNVIIETIDRRTDGALRMPAVLVRSHGPFTWGRDADQAVVNAIALEAVAAMALRTLAIEPQAPAIQEALLRRHFDRKHGPGAYYGQPGDEH
ncbi:MAG: L-ribulose-5-phosphate 4-epimerase AraD [Chloroflexota bacterium]|jgi:L-ribulose-5-phosphate 4-epimerase